MTAFLVCLIMAGTTYAMVMVSTHSMRKRQRAMEQTLQQLVAVVGGSDRNLLESGDVGVGDDESDPPLDPYEWDAFLKQIQGSAVSDRYKVFRDGAVFWRQRPLDQVQPVIRTFPFSDQDNAFAYYMKHRTRE